MPDTYHFPKGLGLIPDQPDERDYRLQVARAPDVDTAFTDYEDQMTPVKDQGQLGSCVAFGTVAVKEWQERKQRRRGRFDFSEAFLYELIRLPGGGAYPRSAMKVLADIGLPRENFLPYTEGIDEANPSSFTPTGRQLRNASYYVGGDYVRLDDIPQMEASLAVNGPFVLGVHWIWAWDRFASEHEGYPVLGPNAGGSGGGHLIAVVGHDRSRSLFKVRNSWGDEWAKGGYAFLTYEALQSTLIDSWATFDMVKAASHGLSVDIPEANV